MTIEELEVISESVENIVKIKAINALLEAINDWPVEIETVDDYFKEVLGFLGLESSEASLISIRNRMKPIDIKTNAWRLESIESLLLVFQSDKSNVIRTVFNELIRD